MKPPVLTALFDELPDAGDPFDPFARERWTAAMIACLEVAYPRHVRALPAPTAALAAVDEVKPTGLPLHTLRKHPDGSQSELEAAPADPKPDDAAAPPPPGPTAARHQCPKCAHHRRQQRDYRIVER